MVFPLGMYSVATLSFGKVTHLAFMKPLARFLLWVAIAAWALVVVAFLAQLARHPEESASGTPPASGTAAASDTATEKELPEPQDKTLLIKQASTV